MMRRGGGTVAWFNCSAGVAGDMLLGALVDAGADPAEVAGAVAGLGIDGYALTFERVQRSGVRATWANVVVDSDHGRAAHHGTEHRHTAHDHAAHRQAVHDHAAHRHAAHRHADHHGTEHAGGGHPHRPAGEVLALIERAELPERVRARALEVYRALAEVEGEIHGIPAEEVELHEVGATDAIVDVVGTCAALESLGVDHIVCGPLAVGSGTVRAAHGTLPNPAPAVVRLLARQGAPAHGIDTPMELATPTGVALVTTLAGRFGPLPEMAVGSVGFGAGTADPPGRPNVVNVVIGSPLHDRRDASGRPGSGRSAHLVEVNVDDATPEVLAHTVGRLLGAGAHDAWVTPIVMKKGRPAHTVSALCDDPTLGEVVRLLIAETGTLGVRATRVERWPQQRREITVEVEGHPIRVKLAGVAGATRVKVEHDDAAAAADALGLPLRVVMDRATASVDPANGMS